MAAPLFESCDTVVDTQSLRKSVRSAIISQSEWDRSQEEEGYGAVDDLIKLAKEARPWLNNGDCHTALAILETVTDELRKHWQLLEESGGETNLFFQEELSLWLEALLNPDLTTAERERWVKQLMAWASDFDQYSAEYLTALAGFVQQGWDDPRLRRILQGETVPGGLWGDPPPPQARDATLARLRILERTGQDEAYLNLAKAQYLHKLRALHLLKLGRVPEAINASLEPILPYDERLELAKALYDRGEIEAALQVAEQGLKLDSAPPPSPELTAQLIESGGYNGRARGELAIWLRDRATERHETARALAAGLIAFRAIPSLAAYQRAKQLAKADWPNLRQELLDFLRQGQHVDGQTRIEIFLHENLIDDAIQSTDRYTSSKTLAQVMDAAIKHQPRWVIDQARQKAEPIMDEGKSAQYAEAVDWLRKVKQAYHTLGQDQEWRDYLGALREKHRRLRKLMPMLVTL
jgi:uncharacterized Zn finger protein